MKSLIKTLIYVGVGALIGLAYYTFVGCQSGSCPITSSPVNSMLYMGFMGFLLSGNCCCLGGNCKVNYDDIEEDTIKKQ